MQCAKEALVSGSEDVAVYVCQLLVDMVEVPAPLTQPHLPAIVAFCMEVGLQTHTHTHTHTRDACGDGFAVMDS